VAAIAALLAAKAGWQAAFLAPTEILALQHERTVRELLNPFTIPVALLTNAAARLDGEELGHAKLVKALNKGEIPILIGTHAIIQERVQLPRLALAIVDEQHRFGVEQRASLLKNGATDHTPHLLSMTATPIPRTLALTIYGDLDLSLLDEMPKGRKKIITNIVPPAHREAAYQFIRKEVKNGRQVFVICPRIDPERVEGSGVTWDEVKAVKVEHEKLSKTICPDLRVAMLHGKMPSKEKETTMQAFAKGNADILVSTSVIEVGVDVPNASVMMIDGAEHFGLAQLHQFRGRVGRGLHQAYCFLLTDSPAKATAKRLQAIVTSQNGFELAEKDLQIRGPGDFYGVRQSGLPDLTMASLRDIKLIHAARMEAQKLLDRDPALAQFPLLKVQMEEFKREIHFE
ncbi:DEAD/DEAH box helicase, partial [Candidatus Azambacteria bacterium]|nr:DEAD/DEAH box helicase [Candidatus Azambacteria bacterium]